jgi:hypothetical protein
MLWRAWFRRLSFTSLVLTVCADGCVRGSPITTPASSPILVTVDEHVVTFVRRPTFAFVRVGATVHNRSDRPLYGDVCYVEAQREIEQKWVTVWNESCLVEHLTTIAPGDSLRRTFTIKGSFAPDDPMKADPRLTAGTYRITFPLSFSASGRIPQLVDLPPENARSSEPFEIRDP